MVSDAMAPRGFPTAATARALVAAGLFLALEWRISQATGNAARPMLLGVIGLAIGAALLGTDFGFSSAFRRAATAGDYRNFRAHALMFALASAMIVPLIAQGSAFGHPIAGFATPIGPGFVVGAAIFGAGMQMAGGCASGTLYLLGGGNVKFAFTLLFFVLGSTIGAAHIGFWRGLPAFEPITVFSLGPWPLGLAGLLIALALVARLTWRRGATLTRQQLFGAVALALLNVATVLVAGRPWSETYGFALWGSKIAAALGWRPAEWAFWAGSDGLSASVFADQTSIMDLSILVGALLAGALKGGEGWRSGGGARSWLAAGLGGVLMGYGARLAGGCNIGAYFSAIASGDFSGWLWAGVALAATGGGIALRRRIEQG